MTLISCPNLITILLHSCFCFVFCTAIDTITPTQFIKDPESIISNGSIFKLGFFSPNSSSNRYVGIWYNQFSVPNIVWVANRDNPLNDSSGVITISEEGNLLVSNGQNVTLWSSNVSNTATNASAQLLDSGNLVLQEVNSNTGDYNRRIIWESFQHPGNSLLSKMKLTTNVGTGEKQQITSWISSTDPSSGSFSMSLDPLNIPEVFIWNGSSPYWRTGPWNGQIFIGIPNMNSVYLDGFTLVDDKDGSYYLTFEYADKSHASHYVLNSQGTLEQIYWDNGTKNWETGCLAPESKCDVYSKCGAFGSRNSRISPICSCLRGFEPKNIEEWSRGNWTSGCVRRTELQCERVNSGGGEKGKEDGFLKLNMMKVPGFPEFSSDGVVEGDCQSECLKNCSCLAYAYDTGIGCMLWSGNLFDVQEFSSGGTDLYLRVAYSELDKRKDIKVIITVVVIIGTITIAICAYFSWMRITKRRAKMKQHKAYLKFSNRNVLEDNDLNQAKLQELPLFNFEKLANATNNFHIDNKLG